MLVTRSRTERPRDLYSKLDVESWHVLRRIGGRLRAWFLGRVEPSLKYHPSLVGTLTQARDPGRGQRLVGSLTGAVASQKVTEAPKGSSVWLAIRRRVQGHKGACETDGSSRSESWA